MAKQEDKIKALRAALIAGENSGSYVSYDMKQIIQSAQTSLDQAKNAAFSD